MEQTDGKHNKKDRTNHRNDSKMCKTKPVLSKTQAELSPAQRKERCRRNENAEKLGQRGGAEGEEGGRESNYINPLNPNKIPLNPNKPWFSMVFRNTMFDYQRVSLRVDVGRNWHRHPPGIGRGCTERLVGQPRTL